MTSKSGSITREGAAGPLDEAMARIASESVEGRDPSMILRLHETMTEDGTKQLSVRVRREIPELSEYLDGSHEPTHKFQSIDSLIEYALWKGKAHEPIVWVGDNEIVYVPSDVVDHGPPQCSRLSLGESEELQAWREMFDLSEGGVIEHSNLIAFLTAQEHTLVDPLILNTLRRADVKGEINIESGIMENEKVRSFSFKAKASTEVLNFPKEIPISIPLLEIDVSDDSEKVTLPVKLRFDLPDHPTGRLTFKMSCPSLRKSLVVRRTSLIDKLKHALWGEDKNKPIVRVMDGAPGWRRPVMRPEANKS